MLLKATHSNTNNKVRKMRARDGSGVVTYIVQTTGTQQNQQHPRQLEQMNKY